ARAKPPRGYDPSTLAADVAGVIRSLGARDAVVVGHGWGGLVAWTVAVAAPGQVRRICGGSVGPPRAMPPAPVKPQRAHAGVPGTGRAGAPAGRRRRSNGRPPAAPVVAARVARPGD